MNEKKLVHDFTNSSLRIEIINKLILEEIQASKTPIKKHLTDLESTLHKHIELLSEMKSTYSH